MCGTETSYTFTSKSWAASPANWTSGEDGNQMQSGRGIQVTKGTSGANGTSPTLFTNVSQVIVTYSTNASDGAGSIAVQIGSNTAVSQNVTKTGGTTDRTLTYNFSPNQTGKVKITVTCTTNSIYIKSVTIIENNSQSIYTIKYDSLGTIIKTETCTTTILPTLRTSDVCASDGWEFAGWSESNTDYSILKNGSYTPTNDITLYAVYKKSEGENRWTKLTSDTLLSNGMKVIIIAPECNKALYHETISSSYCKYWNFNINNIDNDVKNYLTIFNSEIIGEWYFGDNTNGWLYNSSSNNLKFDETNKSSWGLEYTNNKFSITTNSRCLSCRNDLSGDNQYKFRMGGSTCDAGEHEFDIYAKISSSEYSFNPSCCENNITINKFPTENGSFDLNTNTVCGDGDGGEVEIINIVPYDGYMLDTILAVDTVNMNIVGTTNMDEHKITGIKTNCVVVVVFKPLPPKPEIDVVEWNPNYIKVDIDNFDAVTAVIENKNTQEIYTENVATELFFSKYFEAETTVKLLGIYNGKKDSVNLSSYKIKAADGKRKTSWDKTYDLTNLGWIHSGEEIIIYSYSDDSDTNPVVTCIENYSKTGGFSNYIRAKSGSVVSPSLTFNGDDAIGLFKDDVLIDIIGAGTSDAICVNGLKGKTNGEDTTMYETHIIDNYCWITDTADNSNGYSNVIATDLCLLIRKSNVHSGDSAVKYNTTDFVTLGREWFGKLVSKKDSSTCKNFDYVGSFDYNEHYSQYIQVGDEILLGQTEPDGTYKINIQNLDTLSCTYLKVIVSDNSNKSEECEYKIPIFVSNTVTSTAELFTKEGSDCPECDVIILNGGKLTISGEFTSRDITVYPGGVLIIPENAIYNVNSLTLRRDNNEVPYFSYKGILNFSDKFNSDKFNVDLRTDANEWRWMTLPFSHKVSDIRYPNGKKPLLNSEIYISYYDGKYRSINKKSAWKDIETDSTFNAGEGFLFGVNLPGQSKKTYRFSFNNIETEKSNKTINNLFAWGGNNPDLAPNHKGWNLIGNPFMDSDTTDIINPIRIGTLKKDSINGHWTGGWVSDTIEDVHGKKLRYAVVPSKDPEDIDAGGYKSVVLDDYVLQPLTSFFVQIGGNESDMKEITFKPEKRINRIIAKTASNDEEDEETFLRVKVGKWKTGCFISNKFNDTYEPGDDLESRYPIYQTIGGYKLLYSAINDSIIENGVKVISPNGILHLDQKVNTKYFEYIYVNYDNNWFNLLNGETVDISNGEFILQAKRRKLNVTTDINSVIPKNKTFKFSDGRHIYINSNNSIYTVLGIKLK